MKTIVLALLLFGVVSCAKQGDHVRSGKQILHLVFPYDPNSLDTRKSADFVAPAVHRMLYEGLTRMSATSTHEPALAETIELSEDRLTYTFHLREASWSDGSPVTAYDFAYAWRTSVEPGFPCPSAYLFYPIKNAYEVQLGKVSSAELGVQAIDAKTFQVTLNSPMPYFLDIISYCAFSPVPHKIVQNNPKWADSASPTLVTNGPFLLTEWTLNDALVFVKNPHYWDKENIRLDKIEAYIISNESTALNMFTQGQIDYYGGFSNAIPEDYLPALKKTNLLHTQQVGATTFVTFNLSVFPFTNKNIRKAFAYAINRQEIIDHITGYEPATGCIAPLLKGGRKRAFHPDGDVIKARVCLQQGLKELGVDKNALQGLVYRHYPQPTHKKVAQTLQDQWKKALDIEVVLDEADFKTQVDRLNRRDYVIAQAVWVVQFSDPMNVFERFKQKVNPKNYPGWEDSTYAALLDQSNLAASETERLAILEQAEERIAEEMPFSGVYHWDAPYLQQEYLKGVYMSPIGSIHWNRAYIERKK